jgi:hypothetical protein
VSERGSNTSLKISKQFSVHSAPLFCSGVAEIALRETPLTFGARQVSLLRFLLGLFTIHPPLLNVDEKGEDTYQGWETIFFPYFKIIMILINKLKVKNKPEKSNFCGSISP